MNKPSDEIIERVLDNRASRDEAQCVAEWFTSIEGQREMSERMSRDFVGIESGEITLAEDIPSDELYNRLMRHFRRVRITRIAFRVAAVLLPCLLVLGIGYRLDSRVGGLFSPVEYAEIYAPRGERMHMVFQDGTHMYINSETRVRYPKKFGLTHRDVFLDGEAYFEVSHNARRPFTVHIGESKIRVLGTSFDVMAYGREHQVDVTLDEGSIQMTDGTNTYLLAPSDRLIYDKQEHRGQLIKTHDSRQSSRWKDNVLVFRDASLSEVIKVLGRWYNVDFNITDPSVHKYYYTFESDNEPLDTIIREMERIAPVKFVRQADHIDVALN